MKFTKVRRASFSVLMEIKNTWSIFYWSSVVLWPEAFIRISAIFVGITWISIGKTWISIWITWNSVGKDWNTVGKTWISVRKVCNSVGKIWICIWNTWNSVGNAWISVGNTWILKTKTWIYHNVTSSCTSSRFLNKISWINPATAIKTCSCITRLLLLLEMLLSVNII